MASSAARITVWRMSTLTALLFSASLVYTPAAGQLLSFPSASSAVGMPCLSPSGAIGRCVSAIAFQCTLFTSIADLVRKRPRICAFSKMDAIVCCPLSAIADSGDPRPPVVVPRTTPTPATTRRPSTALTRLTRRTTTRPRITEGPVIIPTTRAAPSSAQTTAPAPRSTSSRAPSTLSPLVGIPHLPTGIPRRTTPPPKPTPQPRFSIAVQQPGCGRTAPFQLFRHAQTGRYLQRPPLLGRAVAELLGAQPWTALIGVTDGAGGGTWVCAGALLSPRLVLTAAQCAVLGSEPERIVVGLGEHDMKTDSEGGGELVTVSQVHRHPDWRPPLRRHGLALLVLERSARVPSELVNTVCLPLPDPARSAPTPEPAADSTLLLSAYHLDVHNSASRARSSRGRLAETALTVAAASACRRWLAEDPLSEMVLPGGPRADSEVCLMPPGSCEEDVGAPLVSRSRDSRGGVVAVLEGLTMLDGCQPRQGMLAVRVRKYVPWILQTMESIANN